MKRLRCIFVLALGLPALVPGARAASPAPAFALPRLGGGGTIASDSLFSARSHTFLVFWWSHCPRCLESLRGCEEFYQAQRSESLAVVGIDGDEGDAFVVHAVIRASGVTFPQLRDPGGAVAARYGIPAGSFSVSVVNRDGRIVATRIDPQEDVAAVLSAMHSEALGAGAQAASPGATGGGAPAAPEPALTSAGGRRGLVVHTDDRVRFLSIDTHGTQALGAYGEELTPGNRLDLRVEVEAAQRLGSAWRAGGLLRITTEDEEVLDSGPKYFGSQFGSAFVEYETASLGGRAGYYTLFMTPLSLMRWDWDDSPRTGSTAGCGCAAGAGTLRVESLDDLAPELTFEGGIVRTGGAGFDLRTFYAQPHRARSTSYTAYRTGGEPPARYALELYGAEARWQRLDARTGGFYRAGVHLAGTRENHRSVDFVALGYPALDPWTENWILTASGEVPLVRYVRLRGEVVGWNETRTRVPAVPDGSLDSEVNGNGGMAGVVAERSATFNLKLDYLRLDSGYHSTFGALSYGPDKEGLRVSAQLPVPDGRGVASLFYKRLREDEAPSGAEREQQALAGLAADVAVYGALGAGAGWIDDHVWREGDVLRGDRQRHVFTANLTYTFMRNGTVLLEYQRTHEEDEATGSAVVSTADICTVQVTAGF